jgi:hypothetical protein
LLFHSVFKKNSPESSFTGLALSFTFFFSEKELSGVVLYRTCSFIYHFLEKELSGVVLYRIYFFQEKIELQTHRLLFLFSCTKKYRSHDDAYIEDPCDGTQTGPLYSKEKYFEFMGKTILAQYIRKNDPRNGGKKYTRFYKEDPLWGYQHPIPEGFLRGQLPNIDHDRIYAPCVPFILREGLGNENLQWYEFDLQRPIGRVMMIGLKPDAPIERIQEMIDVTIVYNHKMHFSNANVDRNALNKEALASQENKNTPRVSNTGQRSSVKNFEAQAIKQLETIVKDQLSSALAHLRLDSSKSKSASATPSRRQLYDSASAHRKRTHSESPSPSRSRSRGRRSMDALVVSPATLQLQQQQLIQQQLALQQQLSNHHQQVIPIPPITPSGNPFADLVRAIQGCNK